MNALKMASACVAECPAALPQALGARPKRSRGAQRRALWLNFARGRGSGVGPAGGTDPELKGGRSSSLQKRVFFAGTTKKETGLCFSCHLRREWPKAGCCTGQECAVPKITYDASDRKTSPDAPGIYFWNCFWSTSRPEHNQRPPTDTAKRHFALIPTRRKKSFWPLGAQSTPPLARGRSRATRPKFNHEFNLLASLPKDRRPPVCALPLDRALVSVGRGQ